VARRKVGEETARHIIGMMRSIASHVPVSPFHLHAADVMEKMLDELLKLRAENEALRRG